MVIRLPRISRIYLGSGCYLPNYAILNDGSEYVDEWFVVGRKNIFGETVLVQEMQSEAVLQALYMVHYKPVR